MANDDMTGEYSATASSESANVESQRDAQKAKSYLDGLRAHAKKIHDDRSIYFFFGFFDGINLSYSTLKYLFDLYLADSKVVTADYMHDWMLTPEGIAITATESVFIIAFSMMGNYYDDDDKNIIKRYAAILWPYCRDILKATKNAFKGWRSLSKIIELLHGSGLHLNPLLLPLSLTLGAIGIANRIWCRQMVNERKAMMKNNMALYDDIVEGRESTKQIQRQTIKTRASAFFSAALGGLIDSLYLYLGIVFLTQVASPVFVFLVAVSVVLSISCIVTRVYEEYEYQRRLIESEKLVEFADDLKAAELKLRAIYHKLYHPDKKETRAEQIEALKQERDHIANQLHAKRLDLLDILRPTYTIAFLMGLRHGLSANSAIASVLFAVATILALCSVSLPPAALIAVVAVGLGCMFGFIAESMISNYYRRKGYSEEKINLTNIDEAIRLDFEVIKSGRIEQLLGAFIRDHHRLDPAPLTFVQELFEILRSFFSGLGKSSKAIDFSFNPLQEQDDKGHYQDTPIMLVFTGVSAIFFSLTLSIRALARGFGKEPLGILNRKKAFTAEHTAPEVVHKSKSAFNFRDFQPPKPSHQKSRSLSRNWGSFFKPDSRSASPKVRVELNEMRSSTETLVC